MTRRMNFALLTVTSCLLAACSGSQKAPASTPVATTPKGNELAMPLAVSSSNPDGDREGEAWGIMDPPSPDYGRVVDSVAHMTNDVGIVRAVTRRGLSVVNVTWEDTGRAEGSSLGPNISDLTLQVRRRERGGFVDALMPVIRFPNFTDRTGDVPADKFFVRVGNERQGDLRTVPLSDVLKNLRAFATLPSSIGGSGDLTAPRDSHYLVSAQAVFLPIPKTGKAEFNPVLFNYQSSPGSPAALTILVTREGTSIRVIENRSEDSTGGGGQEIYFNNKGQKSAFTAERKSDVEQRIAAQGGPKNENDRSALAKGADVLFLVQVPLKHAQLGRLGGALPGGAGGGMAPSAPAPMPMKPSAMAKKSASAESAAGAADKSDVEQAVLGHGPNVGPFNEGHRLRLERDPKFPIRITVQFYKATSNGAVSDIDLDSISRSIGSVYEHADAVGSLVMPDGDPRRPTAWQKVPHEWFPW